MMDNHGLKRWLKDNGFSLEAAGNGHWRVRWASGDFAGMISSSPHNGARSVRNTIANLRRNGVPIPRK